MHFLFDDLVKSRMTFYMLSICMNNLLPKITSTLMLLNIPDNHLLDSSVVHIKHDFEKKYLYRF